MNGRLAAFLALLAGAETFTTLAETAKLTATTPAGAFGNFFDTVALDGDYAAGGAYNHNNGAVFVYSTPDSGASWVYENEIVSSDATAGEDFGSAVALVYNGATLLSCAYDNGPGYCYTFTTTNGWTSYTETQKWSATDAQTGARFGYSMAAHGDLAVVGATKDDTQGSDAGRVYAFKSLDSGTTYTQQQILTTTDSNRSGDHMGQSVAVYGDTIAAALRFDDHGGHNGLGTAHWWRTADGGATWTIEGKLIPHNLAASIGVTMCALGGSAAALGSFTYSSNTGRAWTYSTSDFSSWTNGVTVTPQSPATGGLFSKGLAISPSGEYLAVGDRVDGSGGSVDVYVSADSGVTWTMTYKLTASDGVADDYLGGAIQVLDTGRVVVGAGGVDSGNGALYVFELVGPGSGGDPVLVDLAGHRFLAGFSAHQELVLLSAGGESVVVQTGTVRGREHGYFLSSARVTRVGCGAVEFVPVPGKLELQWMGDGCMRARAAAGDNGLAVVTLGDGDGAVAVRTHVSNGFSFLNLKLLAISPNLRKQCSGLLCDESHAL